MAGLIGKARKALHYSLVEPAREEPRIILLGFATLFMTMAQGIVVPILPLLVKSYGLSATAVGLAVSSFALARVFANIPAGMLTRVYGVRTVLMAGALLSVVGNLFIGFSGSYGALVALRFVAGLGSALFITGAVIFVATVSTTQNRGRLMSIYQAFFLLGISLGPPMGGIVADLFGLNAPFFLVAGVSALSAVWSFTRLPKGVAQREKDVTERKTKKAEAAAAGKWYREPAFLSVSLLALAVFFTRAGALFTLWPLLGKEKYLLGPGLLGVYFLVPSMVNMVTQPFVGFLADKFGRRAVLIPTVGLFAMALLVSAWVPFIGFFALGMALYGIAQALEGPTANSYVAEVVPAPSRPVALGVYRTVADVGLLLGAPLLGLIADGADVPWALTANAGFLLVAGVVFFVVGRKETTKRPEARVAG